MAKGFPKHILELSQRAAGHVNLADVFNHPEGDTLFEDAAGKLHDISLHTKYGITIEEAFNEVFTAAWGNLLALPIAPALFDYQPVDPKTRAAENGYGCFIASVQMHKHAVRVETVLEHAAAREKGKPYPAKSYDATMWSTLAHELEVPPLLKMEGAIFHHIIKPLSEILPYMEWVGIVDANDSNQILNMPKALRLVQDFGDTQGNDLGFYLCDFGANSLETGNMLNWTAEEIARIDICRPVSALSSIVERYPSLCAAETKLAKTAREDDWYGIRTDYPEALIIPVFAPHLDFASMRKTIHHIQRLEDDTIRGEMMRLASAMARIIPDETIIARLNSYAGYMTNALITRRDILVKLVDTQLSHEANPHSHTNNPFEVFQNVIAEEADGYRERRRLLTGAKRPSRKPKPSPKGGNDHE